VKNLPDGNWKWNYPSGKLLRDEQYKNGKEDGPSTEYDEAEVIIAQGNLVGGLREGPWKYKNGQYIAEGNYVEGNQDGIWKQYYENGKLAGKWYPQILLR
jgi:antitoxin component YwqK of YwqJK toxin-antitoxin module